MATCYSKFTPEDIDALGIDIEQFYLFEPKTPVPPSARLAETLKENLEFPLGTEKAKSELIITPVLSELRRNNPDFFALFSGYNFNVDKSRGIVLDENGWVDVAELLEKLNAKNSKESLTFERLLRVVAEKDKQRFIFNADKTRIRANQGHTVDIDLGLTPTPPPAVLYHGTATTNIESIQKNGINKGKRQHVHLSKDTETATKVGARHGKPTILTINTEKMHQDGIAFFCAENGVWLTDFVAVAYIIF